jgi:Cu+-exporting ATPase
VSLESPTTATRPEPVLIELTIDGMTCAACVRRVERALASLSGVSATVNLATATASVRCSADLDRAALVDAVARVGYGARWPAAESAPSDQLVDLRRRLVVGAPLTAGVLALPLVPALPFGYRPWLALALAAPVVLWGAWPVHRAALRFAGRASMTGDTLVSLGSSAALGWSLYSLLAGALGHAEPVRSLPLIPGSDLLYLDAATGIVVLLLVTRYLQARGRRRAAVFDARTSGVTVLRHGDEVPATIGELEAGSHFVARPGETIAADGVVVEGSSAVDTSLLTGAGNPVEVRAGELVAAGSVNVGGRLVVRASALGPDTRLARTARQVAAAQRGRTALQRRAEQVSAMVAPVVLGVAVAVLGFRLGAGASPTFAVGSVLAVLVVAVPAALGLAVPLAVLTGTGRGAQLGILIRSAEVVDALRRVDTVVLDKTGTVTSGAMTVRGVHPADGVPAELALRLAGAVEQACAHPVGRAITAAAVAAADGELPGVAEFDSLAGLGVRGLIAEVEDGRVVAHAVLVGRPALLTEHGIELPDDLVSAREAAEAAGHTAVAVAWDGVARAVLAVGDVLRPASGRAMRRLRGLGLRPVLLTGDTGNAARVLAEQVGVEPEWVLAEVRPEDKVDVVRRLQDDGRRVAVIGDGIDDAEALAVADFAVAVGGRADGHLTVTSGELPRIVDGLRLVRRIRVVITGNLGWLLAHHLVALPLAAAGLLHPLAAAGAAAASSAVVVVNCLRLRRFATDQDADIDVT